MSLYDFIKLTCWITLLLLVFFPHCVQLKLTKPTIKYINRLYRSPFIHDLINNSTYRDRYLGLVFQHFRDDFQYKRIGNFRNSHWPGLLQDLNLLPRMYHTPNPIQDRRPMRIVWMFWQQYLKHHPIAYYHETMVRVPLKLVNVFQDNVEQYQVQTRSIHYDFLVKEMQSFVDNEYGTIASASNYRRKELLKKITGKVLHFKAIYWLTVLDQFVGVVQRMVSSGVQLGSPSPRTELIVGPPPPYPQNPGPKAQSHSHQTDARVGSVAQPMAKPLAHPVGLSETNPVRDPSKKDGAQSRGTKRKATNQGGGLIQGSHKKGPRGVMDGISLESKVRQMP